VRLAGWRSPRRPLACRCALACGFGARPAARSHNGRDGARHGDGEKGGSPVRGPRGGCMLVGERGGAIWMVRPMPIATVGAWVLAVVAAVWAVSRFAVAAAAACLSVCGGVRSVWSARCPGARWARGCWRWWRRYWWVAGWRSPRRPHVCRCVGGCDWGGLPVSCRRCDCGVAGGFGGFPVGGHRGDRGFVCVGGCPVWTVRRLAVATAGTLVFASAVVVLLVWRLAVTAAAACLSVCVVMRFGPSARCSSPWWPPWSLRLWRWFARFVSWRSPRRPSVCWCAGLCGLGSSSVAYRRAGRLGDCWCGGGLRGSTVGGRCGGRVFVCVRGVRSGWYARCLSARWPHW